MKRPALNIQTSLKVDDSKEIKSPNASISPSENDFFNKISGLDPQSVLDFRGEDMSASTAKESVSVSSPVSAANIRLSISEETPNVSPFKDARPNFIKKVLALLFLQMAITVLSIGLTFIPNIGVREFMSTNTGAIIAAGIITLTCLIILACKRDACRKVPRNYLLLFIFTFGMSYILGSVSACTTGNVVLVAGICTLVIVIAISLYACKTKSNLTNSGMGIVTFLSAALLAVVISVVWPAHILTAFYSAVAACIFGFHLAFDIQKLAGKYENQYSLDDYIIASMDIYIDIIQIFVALVNILRRLVPWS